MDDFNMNSLQESKNEWVSRLVNILAPHITDGFRQIYTESFKLCIENDEEDKYLMTFQNFVARIPKWNNDLIDEEVKRIIEKSNCGYIITMAKCHCSICDTSNYKPCFGRKCYFCYISFVYCAWHFIISRY